MRIPVLVPMRTTSGEPILMRLPLIASSDFNYVLQDGECVAAGPEPVPAGTCNRNDDKYLGSSGYRLIPGNSCDKGSGVIKDEPIMKDCSSARPEDGAASHVVVSNSYVIDVPH